MPLELLEVPALYALKLFSLSVASAIASDNFLIVPGGTGQLYDNAAQFLGADALLDAEVSRVVRRAQRAIEVDVETPAGLVRVVCEKLVVACPPTLQNLRPLDLDALETRTFNRFRANYYGTALVELSGLPAGQAVQNVRADTPYQLPALPGIYSLDPSPAPGLWNVKFGSANWLPDQLVRAKIVAGIEALNTAGTFPAQFEQFIAFEAHTPFQMMVSSQQIAAGFYRTLGSLQGRRGTFYASAALQTNNSSLIWRFVEGLLPQLAA